MTRRLVVLEITRMEATHLAGLVMQFSDLLTETGDRSPSDPAVARLVPDAYPDDAEAAQEFRSLTQRDLLDRRSTDAAAVLASLHDVVEPALDPHDEGATQIAVVELDADGLQSWLRTLAAVRLVLASRLGIVDEDDHDEDDPRFGIYDWLGYRLEGLVKAAEGA
ncbi:DUF2017 family protein [Microbacterium sp. SS28]|uniref:DUF2017 family protein n=1 Tax=Microbacterium sp. SS28 TaxID=2919948 RepID=UPI001FAA1247|nr:DUF2017 family protein [Microbacterium sp. SS28]